DFVQGIQQPEETEEVEEAEAPTDAAEAEEVTDAAEDVEAAPTAPDAVVPTAETPEVTRTPVTEAADQAQSSLAQATEIANSMVAATGSALSARSVAVQPAGVAVEAQPVAEVAALPVKATATSESGTVTAENLTVASSITTRTVAEGGAKAPTATAAPDAVTMVTGDKAPTQAIVATEVKETTVLRSPVPRGRPATLAVTKRVNKPARPKPKVTPQRSTASTSGNSVRNTVVGVVGGKVTASPNKQGTRTAKRSKSSGNAAVSNYPGKVMRCISRASRARTNAKGTASIGFSISGKGRITRVFLARSSGNAQLDNAAVRAVRGVGRCPAPPPGARTSFSVKVRGR
ncbi:MAG: TonB family protein, partial [Pseudomonadota bacterium]